MKRLTSRSLLGFVRYKDGAIGEIVERFADIEDILGDDYDLDRLRELAEADREGRCVVLPRLEPGQGDPPGEPGPPGPPGIAD